MCGELLILEKSVIRHPQEERFLRAELGEDADDAYARTTAMLVPFVRI